MDLKMITLLLEFKYWEHSLAGCRSQIVLKVMYFIAFIYLEKIIPWDRINLQLTIIYI